MELEQQHSPDEIKAAQLAYAAAAAELLEADSNPEAIDYGMFSSIGVKYLGEFAQAENERRLTELRWLDDLRQFKGQYSPEVLARLGKNRSKAFVRKTRVKVKTTNARVADLLFPANSQKNWEVNPSPKPWIPKELKAELIKNLTQVLQKDPEPEEIDKAVDQFAKARAVNMSKTIEDQLAECKYKDVAKQVLHSGHLFGTGIMKAPLVERKVRTSYVRVPVTDGGGNAIKGKYKWVIQNEAYVSPFVDFVPLWRWYPDMSATSLDKCRYVYERHLMTKADMVGLANRKSFNGKAIKDYITSNPKGQIRFRYIDSELRVMGDRQVTQALNVGEYEVLERWGWMDATDLLECGIEVPPGRMHETFFGNVWLLPDGTVIKAALEPINGVTWPYHLYYFDKDETSIFGEGIAMIMRDDQDMINASARMMFDNAAITAGPQLDVNLSLLAKGEKATEMYPFKIWPRTGNGEDARAQAVRVLEMPSHLNELGSLREMSENNADEVTAIPRYWQGENPTSGAAGTASGMSMLMGAVGIIAKDCVSNYDQGVTTSFITGMVRWNMQFNPDENIKGDFDCVATGSASMVAKEVRAQQLDAFAAQTANPMDAPFIKRDALLRQRALAHDLNDVVKTEEEVKADLNNAASQMQAQVAQSMQELQMATMKANLANLEADAMKKAAEASRIEADALLKRVSSMYSAMQAAGVAVTNSHITPAADSILQEAGFASAPQSVVPGAQSAPETVPAQGGPVTPMPGPEVGQEVGMREGMKAGMETDEVGDGQAQQQ